MTRSVAMLVAGQRLLQPLSAQISAAVCSEQRWHVNVDKVLATLTGSTVVEVSVQLQGETHAVYAISPDSILAGLQSRAPIEQVKTAGLSPANHTLTVPLLGDATEEVISKLLLLASAEADPSAHMFQHWLNQQGCHAVIGSMTFATLPDSCRVEHTCSSADSDMLNMLLVSCFVAAMLMRDALPHLHNKAVLAGLCCDTCEYDYVDGSGFKLDASSNGCEPHDATDSTSLNSAATMEGANESIDGSLPLQHEYDSSSDASDLNQQPRRLINVNRPVQETHFPRTVLPSASPNPLSALGWEAGEHQSDAGPVAASSASSQETDSEEDMEEFIHENPQEAMQLVTMLATYSMQRLSQLPRNLLRLAQTTLRLLMQCGALGPPVSPATRGNACNTEADVLSGQQHHQDDDLGGAPQLRIEELDALHPQHDDGVDSVGPRQQDTLAAQPAEQPRRSAAQMQHRNTAAGSLALGLERGPGPAGELGHADSMPADLPKGSQQTSASQREGVRRRRARRPLALHASAANIGKGSIAGPQKVGLEHELEFMRFRLQRFGTLSGRQQWQRMVAMCILAVALTLLPGVSRTQMLLRYTVWMLAHHIGRLLVEAIPTDAVAVMFPTCTWNQAKVREVVMATLAVSMGCNIGPRLCRYIMSCDNIPIVAMFYLVTCVFVYRTGREPLPCLRISMLRPLLLAVWLSFVVGTLWPASGHWGCPGLFSRGGAVAAASTVLACVTLRSIADSAAEEARQRSVFAAHLQRRSVRS